ncbi:ectonucleoside triphosphate diphosphohydrolase 4-like [Haliotis cracherodii]|uniref:ectonucleoside triphosphate diphosphohydrolase 4-like n=1 Tax=Haliotis cracherodii TaxID=6455 RepID=UPI0039EA1540
MSMARIYINWPCPSMFAANQQGTSRKSFFIGSFIIVAFILLCVVVVVKTRSADRPDNKGDKSELEDVNKSGSKLHYGIVIDCGSSGSRIYVYYWPPHSGKPGELLNIQQLRDGEGNLVVKKVAPGLSEYEDTPHDASDHISKLLRYASQYIPKEHHKETPLYILATAGMRMIPEKAQKAILTDLLTDIPKLFDFQVAENHFEVISGKLEGVYAWIAVNYVLDKFSHGPEDHALVSVKLPGQGGKTHLRRRTVGMMDMGGGSVQIAFEVLNEREELPKHLVAEVNLGCQDSDTEHTYRVYVTTFLGYGANSARERYEEKLLKQAAKLGDSRPGQNTTYPVLDPCLPQSMPLESEDEKSVKHYFKGTGSYDECRSGLMPLLNLTVPCPQEPCSMNGVSQPLIDHTRSSFYGFSEFWYSMEDVYHKGGNYSSAIFNKYSSEFCGSSWSQLSKWYDQHLYPKADEARFKYQCFKAAWLSTVFHNGFKFPEEYKNLKSAQLINNKDVQWTLGALIYRTRYIPLRDIEKHQMEYQSMHKPSWFRVSRLFYNEYLILVCFFIVLASIVLYMQRLRLCPKRTNIRRVPSMSYFLTEEDQMEQGKKGFIYL